MQLSIDDFLKLRAQLPVVDVRSEGEYQQGHIRAALNIPILNNAERIAVGTDYKQKGQQEAIRTGFRLVGPRLLDIITETEKVGKEILVHCWRGGMRSSNFCQFAGMARVKTHQLTGGYKAYRAKALESYKLPMQLIVISGNTGSGKSEILRALKKLGEQIIDLEHLASHKGSAFGGLMLPPQPTTEQFQNDLFEEINKLDLSKRVWIEDESIAVGKIFLPEGLWRQMNGSPIVEIDVDKSIRIERLVNEYGAADKDLFLQAMTQITKKLGGQHFNAARDKLLQNDMASVIDILLTYYDKAYTNGLVRKKQRVKTPIPWNGKDIDAFAAALIQQAETN
jgi:tRNA 2-selenouridine synthase